MVIKCPNGTLDVLARNNGSDLLFYSKFAPTLHDIFEKISYPMWCTLGLPGSILSTYIWSRRNMRHSGSSAAAVYQSALGIMDTSFFVVQLFWYLHAVWKLRTLDWPIICEGFAVANYFIQYSSPMLTLVFTTERYIAICFPFRTNSRRFGSNYRSSIQLTLICFGICAILSSVQGIFYTISDDKCGLRAVFEEEGEKARLMYTSWTMFTELIMFGAVPFVCLILDMLVIRTLRKVNRNRFDLHNRRKASDLQRRNTKASSIEIAASNLLLSAQGDSLPASQSSKVASTITLLCVSFYLIFAHLSVALMVLLYILLPMGDICLTDEQIVDDAVWRKHFRFLTIRSIIESLGISHFAAKFYIYIATSKLFRKQCLFILASCIHSNCHRPSNAFSSSPNQIQTSTVICSPTHSSLALSTQRLTHSNPILNTRHGRGSEASLELHNRRLSSFSKPRPQPGISRTVLNNMGERVQIGLNINPMLDRRIK